MPEAVVRPELQEVEKDRGSVRSAEKVQKPFKDRSKLWGQGE